MNRILVLKNPILDYAWGSKTAIAALLGQPAPSEKPQAEIWMGAHPKAPSTIFLDGGEIPLPELISAYPAPILGQKASERFGGRLPYLFKVLAAAHPLSIQAHPNLVQARKGFKRENEAGIPLDAPHRNYRDENHKPECICALSRFWGLSGFRPVREMIEYFLKLGAGGLAPELALLKSGNIKEFFKGIMGLDNDRRRRVVAEVRDLAGALEYDDPVFRWIGALYRSYPGDIGILAPIVLNLVCLKPGQAMFLPSGELHAYLDGTGIELMANSDNVLRGGLTPKHVDVPELLRVLNFQERQVDILEPEPVGKTERHYPVRAEEFALSVIEVDEDDVHASAERLSVEILLCTAGSVQIVEEGGRKIPVDKGVSVLVPAAAPAYRIEGSGKLFKASVPQGN